MRKIFAPLALILLVIGMLLVPASPVAAKVYQPGDQLLLSGQFVGTATSYNVQYRNTPFGIVLAPDYITVEGRAFMKENVGTIQEPVWRPVGMMKVVWSFNVLGSGADGLATVGNISAGAAQFGVQVDTVISRAAVTSGKGQYKDLVPSVGPPQNWSGSTMSLSLPMAGAAPQPTPKYTLYGATGDILILLKF